MKIFYGASGLFSRIRSYNLLNCLPIFGLLFANAAYASCSPAGGDVVCAADTATGFDDAVGNHVTTFTINDGVNVRNDGNEVVLFDSNPGNDIIDVTINNGATITGTGTAGGRRGIHSLVNPVNVLNNGLISNLRTGIWMTEGSAINNGEISSMAYGLYSSNSLNFINNGEVSSATYGITSSSLELENNGLISASRDGIFILNNPAIATQTVTIDNHATITAASSGLYSRFLGSITVNNHSGARIYGSALGLGGDGDLTLDNAGEIIGENMFGVTFNQASIENSGTISGATGIRFTGNRSGNSLIINSGSITGTNGTAIDYRGDVNSTLTLELQSGSTISGVVNGGAGTDTLRFGGLTAQTFNLDRIGTDFVDFENFSVRQGLTSFSGTTTESFTVESTATLAGTGVFGGLTFRSGSTVAPGNSIGTTRVNGNVVFDSGSTYVVEINPDGTSDKIDVTGTATLNGGTVSVLPENGTYSSGTTSYNILEAAGGISGAFDGTTIAHDFAFLTPSLRYDANNVFLDIMQTQPFVSAATTPNQEATAAAFDGSPSANATPDSGNDAVVSPLMVPAAFGGSFSANATPGSDNEAVLSALLGLDTQQAQHAFDAVSGEVHASMQSTVVALGQVALGTIANRMTEVQGNVSFTPLGYAATPNRPDMQGRGTPFEHLRSRSTADARQQRPEYWIRGYGQIGTVEGIAGFAGSTTNARGVLMGVDFQIQPSMIAGIAAGYGESDISMKARSSSLSSNMAQVFGYASYDQGPWRWRGMLGYARHEFESGRRIVFGGLDRTATADYRGNQFMASAQLGYSHRHSVPNSSNILNFEPFAELGYGHFTTDGFTEVGAASLNLINQGESHPSLTGSLGLKLSSSYEYENLTFQPYVSASWSHSFGDLNAYSTMSFTGGGSFTVAGAAPARDAFNLSTGLHVRLSQNTNVFSEYAATLSRGQRHQSFSGGLRVIF